MDLKACAKCFLIYCWRLLNPYFRKQLIRSKRHRQRGAKTSRVGRLPPRPPRGTPSPPILCGGMCKYKHRLGEAVRAVPCWLVTGGTISKGDLGTQWGRKLALGLGARGGGAEGPLPARVPDQSRRGSLCWE